MELFEYRPWKIVSRCEKCIGYWPYGQRTCFLAAFYSVMFITKILPMIFKLIKVIGVDFSSLIECVIGIAVLLVMLIKLIMPRIKRHYKQQVYEKIRGHFRFTTDLAEARVLRNFYDKGWRFVIAYTGERRKLPTLLVSRLPHYYLDCTRCECKTLKMLFSLVINFIISGLFYGMPMLKARFNHFFNNITPKKEFPTSVDYLVDQDKYFYLILIHIYSAVPVALLVEFTFNSSFILTIHHICGLFDIVRMRVYSTVEESSNSDNGQAQMDVDVSLKAIVDLHSEALELVGLVEQICSITCFVILVMNAAMFSMNYFLIVINVDEGFQLFRYGLVFTLIFVHFYLIFSQGQRIIDSSLSVFDACCDCRWYEASQKVRITLYKIMIRSIRPSRITGGSLFILSMETYGKMLKTGLSFYTVYGSIDY